jgi:hypothetical protein
VERDLTGIAIWPKKTVMKASMDVFTPFGAFLVWSFIVADPGKGPGEVTTLQ